MSEPDRESTEKPTQIQEEAKHERHCPMRAENRKPMPLGGTFIPLTSLG